MHKLTKKQAMAYFKKGAIITLSPSKTNWQSRLSNDISLSEDGEFKEAVSWFKRNYCSIISGVKPNYYIGSYSKSLVDNG